MSKKIRIGSVYYEIETVKNLKSEYGEDLHGQIIHDKFKIRLGHHHTKESRFKTTWHEVLHGISDLYNNPLLL